MPSLSDGPMAVYASFYDSARSFAARYGAAVRGISDASAFAQALVDRKFNSGSSRTGGRDGFASYVKNIIDMTRRRMQCS